MTLTYTVLGTCMVQPQHHAYSSVGWLSGDLTALVEVARMAGLHTPRPKQSVNF